MIRKRFLPSAVALLFVAGSAFAQAQNCPRANCPNPGQNCPRNGQGMRAGAGNARGGPAAMNNRGMRRGGMMMSGGCRGAANAPAAQPDSKK